MCEDEVGAFFRPQELKRDQRSRDAFVTQAHRRGKNNATVEHNVLITGVASTHHPLGWGVVSKRGTFFAAHSKVQLVVLDLIAATFNKPAAFLGWVGKSGERLNQDLVCPRTRERYGVRNGELVQE